MRGAAVAEEHRSVASLRIPEIATVEVAAGRSRRSCARRKTKESALYRYSLKAIRL